MAVGVITTGANASEAEASIRDAHPELTILRSKFIDVSDLRAEYGLEKFPVDA